MTCFNTVSETNNSTAMAASDSQLYVFLVDIVSFVCFLFLYRPRPVAANGFQMPSWKQLLRIFFMPCRCQTKWHQRRYEPWSLLGRDG